MGDTYWIGIRMTDLNEYISASVRSAGYKNRLKKENQAKIAEFISGMPKYTKPIGIKFTWFSSTGKRDLDNIAFAKKFILDKMNELDKIVDDSPKYVQWFTDTIMFGEDGVLLEIFTEPKYPASFDYNPNDISESDLEYHIETILKEAGFSPHYNGFNFLKEGLKIIFLDKLASINMENHVYAKIAEKYNITSIAASKAIWNMVQCTIKKSTIDSDLLHSGIDMTSKQVMITLLSRLKEVVRNECYWEQTQRKRYAVILDVMLKAKRNFLEARNKYLVDDDEHSKTRYAKCKSVYEKTKTNYMNVFNQTPSLMAYEIDQEYIRDNYDLFARVLDIGAEITLLQMKGGR